MGGDSCGDGGAAGLDGGDGGGGGGVFEDYAERLLGCQRLWLWGRVWVGLTGKRVWRFRRVGRKLSSAFKTVMFSPEGDSP